MNATSRISADSSVASSVSLDEEDESPAKVKKKDDNHVSFHVSFSLLHSWNVVKKMCYRCVSRCAEHQKGNLRWTKRLILQQFRNATAT